MRLQLVYYQNWLISILWKKTGFGLVITLLSKALHENENKNEKQT